MPTSVTFIPGVMKQATSSTFEVQNFFLGSMTGKGKGGRGYPGHMRAVWSQQVHEAIIELEAQTPIEPFREARDTLFAYVIVQQPQKKTTLVGVKILEATAYLKEPKRLIVHFDLKVES